MGEQRQCYVCGKPIKGNALGLPAGTKGRHKGKRLYRHPSKCQPGSRTYMRNRALARGWRKTFQREVRTHA